MLHQNTALKMGIPFEAWFWLNVAVPEDKDACWYWRGLTDGASYGRVQYEGVSVNAQRVAYILAKGPIPKGKFICHACDNPPCCNPSHLWSGTNQDNLVDMVQKGRHARVGGRPYSLNVGQVVEIRQRLEDPVNTIRGLAKEYGVGRNTIYRALER